MTLVIELLVGLSVGAHIATWGMYKDSIHEGFTVAKYLRSVAVGTVIAPIAASVADIDVGLASGVILLFGLTYALERASTEFWKTFIRTEDQSKYFIPMQFHVMGRVVDSRLARLVVGMGVVGFALLLFWAARALEPAPGVEDSFWRVALVASLGGWFAAFGGAFKDAPIEGFEILKFPRSPVVAGIFGLLCANFTSSYPLIALCGVGFSVATLETYKTFFFPSKPRGKFAGKPILYPAMLQRRQYFVPLYVLIWIGVVVGFVGAFTERGAA